VWQAFLVEDYGVELHTARLMTHMLVHYFRSEVLKSVGVTYWLAARLDGERVLRLAQVKPLSLDCADRKTPIFSGFACKFRNIISWIA